MGPKGDGTVPQESVDLLQEVGHWMKTNGEAIYGTEKWITRREGPTQMEVKSTTHRAKEGFNLKFTSEDFWFTAKGKYIYAIALSNPKENAVLIKSFLSIQNQIKQIDLVGGANNLNWRIKSNTVVIVLPEDLQLDMKNGFALRVALK